MEAACLAENNRARADRNALIEAVHSDPASGVMEPCHQLCHGVNGILRAATPSIGRLPFAAQAAVLETLDAVFKVAKAVKREHRH